MSTYFENKVVAITGGSDGIGKALVDSLIKLGAKVATCGRNQDKLYDLQVKHSGMPLHTLVADVSNLNDCKNFINSTIKTFGGIDICVNNASAISLTPTLQTDMKRYDLMHQINGRGTFMVSCSCIPHLKKSANPHILMLSPPLDLSPKWFAGHVAYTIAKYNMSLCVLGMAAEFRKDGIAVNALWPRTPIATAAVNNLLGGDKLMRMSRTPEIVADAAHVIFTQPARSFTGQFCIDDTVLYDRAGITDFEHYRVDKTQPLASDFFVPDASTPPPGVTVVKMPMPS